MKTYVVLLKKESFNVASHVKEERSIQKQSSRGVPRKRCSKNMQHIYRRTPILKCDCNFIEIALRHGCSPVNLLHIFRTPSLKNRTPLDDCFFLSGNNIWKWLKNWIYHWSSIKPRKSSLVVNRKPHQTNVVE